MSGDAYREFLALLVRLDNAKIHYCLSHHRAEAIMIEVAVPGERWEIELVDYGDEFHWEVERFRSEGDMEDEAAIENLFTDFSDPIEEPPENHEQPA